MKKLMVTMAALLICCSAFAQKREKSFNLSFNYGTEIETLGIGLKFNYNITDAVRLAPNFTYFIKNDGVNIWDINMDFNYLFFPTPEFKIYPIAGLSLATLHASFGDYSDNLTRFGANLGAGLEYDLAKNWAINLEFKYRIMSDIDQGVVGMGVSYKF